MCLVWVKMSCAERIKLPSELRITKLKELTNVCVPTLNTKVCGELVFLSKFDNSVGNRESVLP